MRLRPSGSRNNASNIIIEPPHRYRDFIFQNCFGRLCLLGGGLIWTVFEKRKTPFSDKVFFLFFCHFFSNNPFPVSDLGHIPVLAKYILTNFRCSARRIASAPLQLQIARKMLSSKLQRNPACFRLSFFKKLLC